MESGAGVSATRDVVVVGGGLAGLAATAALANAGALVTLLEWRPYVGGRAYSYEHPALAEVIDSQHVVLGCCTNVIDLVTRSGVGDSLRWYDALTFLEPGGRESVLQSGVGPAPFHQTMSFLSAPMLGLRDKAGIARGLLEFLRGYPSSDAESFAAWLTRTGQTDRAIRHFWVPVVVGALNDGPERCSVKYAGKIFHESFLRSAEAGRLGIPARPLSEFFAPVACWAESKGAAVQLKAKVEKLESDTDGGWSLQLSSGEEIRAQSVVLATDQRQTLRLMDGLRAEKAVEQEVAAEIVPAPITTVHLWYDREVTQLDHAVLLDTRIQWMFQKSKIRGWATDRGTYLELVISASFAEVAMGREAILAAALEELPLFFPKVRAAKLLKSSVLKEARATFSVVPGFDRWRAEQRTETKGVYIAGDWTRTEWPSTMEGAVRSGRLAAGEVMGDRERFMSPELPASGLMRWLSRYRD